MTPEELYQVIGYLSNPSRIAHIEVEIKENRLPGYIRQYESASELPFPENNSGMIHVVPEGGNKWGREMRIYFNETDTETTPVGLRAISTGVGRRGYEQYNKRVNNAKLIDELVHLGFVLGSPQDTQRIRARVNNEFLGDFDRGFDLI